MVVRSIYADVMADIAWSCPAYGEIFAIADDLIALCPDMAQLDPRVPGQMVGVMEVFPRT